MIKKITLFLVFLTFACKSNNSNIIQDFPKDQNLERKQYAGNMFGNKDGIILFEDKKFPNDNFIWKKTINYISNILPISIVDESLGIITTDWGNIEIISGNNDLYKLNITLDTKNEKNLKVIAFRKTKKGEIVRDYNVEKIIYDNIL